VVQAGETSFRAGLVIKGPIDIDNLCTCRESRDWGKLCAHSVAVGLHWVQSQSAAKPASGHAGPGASQRTARSTASTPLRSDPAASARNVSSLRRAADGEPAELFVILPPNFEQAASRGRVMLVLEAHWSKGRGPLNALPKERAWRFSEQDNRVLERLEEMAPGETPAMLQLAAKDFVTLLPALVEHPRVTLGKSTPVEVKRTPLALPLRAQLQENGEILVTLRTSTAAPVLLADGWVWSQGSLQPLGWRPELGDVFRGPVRITRAQVPLFLSQQWPQLLAAGQVETNFRLEDFHLAPRAPRFLLELKGGLAQLTALLQCAYGSRIMTLGLTSAQEAVWLPDPDVVTRYSTRDSAAEQARWRGCNEAGSPSGWTRALATQWPERRPEFLRARISQDAARMERDARRTIGAEHDAEPGAD
jgi:hypothetical protein